jgi:hypothetical protein
MRTTIFIIISTLILTSCGPEYKIKNGKVYYSSWNEGSGSNEMLIDSADAKTFREISNDEEIKLAKDKSYVFYEYSIITGANPNTFKRVGKYFFTDNSSIYFFGFKHSGNNTWRVDSIDISTFKINKIYPWARDCKNLIYGDLVMNVKDLNQFKAIDEYWGRTNQQVFNEGHIYDSVDMLTFEVIDENRARDKNYRYEYGEKIK